LANYIESRDIQDRDGENRKTPAILFALDGAPEPWAAVRDTEGFFSVAIGRGQDCDIRVPGDSSTVSSISRRHARLFRFQDAYWIEDLGSKNMTFAEGQLVLAPKRLAIPCTIQLGDVRVRLTRQLLTRADYEELIPLAIVPGPSEVTDEVGGEQQSKEAQFAALRAELRMARVFELLVDALCDCRRAELAEARGKQILQILLDAERVDLALGCLPDRLGAALKETGFECGDEAHLTAAIAQLANGKAGKALCIPGKVTESHAWVMPRGDDPSTLDAVTAFSGRDPTVLCESSRLADALYRMVRFLVRQMEVLSKTEREDSRTPQSIIKEPARETVALCKRLHFWGCSSAHRELLSQVERVAKCYLRESVGPLPVVCLLGESGVGKTHLARLIHQLSSHSSGALIEENCANIQETLAESALFGHRKGSFTGAEESRIGFFDLARDGTLFLDEIGNMNKTVQNKLLTVLDTGHFRRVGENEARTTNCFVVLATNRDPGELCREGVLRRDLWYRIQTATITVPPLRDRIEDIPVLCEEKLRQLARVLGGTGGRTLSPHVLTAFERYTWPGNIRELLGSIEAAFRMSPAEKLVLEVEDLPEGLQASLAARGKSLFWVWAEGV
jgi:transcriptional regulator with AAA-type ATPase domain/pSer/pThr/pTyr-binding forkhead associated (FHA) protein